MNFHVCYASSLSFSFIFFHLRWFRRILYAPWRCYFQSKFHHSFNFRSAYGKLLKFLPHMHIVSICHLLLTEVKTGKWWPVRMWTKTNVKKLDSFLQPAVGAFMLSAINSNLTTSCTNLPPYSTLGMPKCISGHEHHLKKFSIQIRTGRVKFKSRKTMVDRTKFTQFHQKWNVYGFNFHLALVVCRLYTQFRHWFIPIVREHSSKHVNNPIPNSYLHSFAIGNLLSPVERW